MLKNFYLLLLRDFLLLIYFLRLGLLLLFITFASFTLIYSVLFKFYLISFDYLFIPTAQIVGFFIIYPYLFLVYFDGFKVNLFDLDYFISNFYHYGPYLTILSVQTFLFYYSFKFLVYNSLYYVMFFRDTYDKP